VAWKISITFRYPAGASRNKGSDARICLTGVHSIQELAGLLRHSTSVSWLEMTQSIENLRRHVAGLEERHKTLLLGSGERQIKNFRHEGDSRQKKNNRAKDVVQSFEGHG
jgi:hypothetical protein